MHDTAFSIGSAAIQNYGPRRRGLIVELGSMNVNGSLRSAAPASVKYIGVDQAGGAGVDLVVPTGSKIPLAHGSADLVVASSVLEHDFLFWETFSQMCKLAKPGGHIYLNAPSNGIVHRFPADCWRFYPDAGLALERYSRKSRWPVRLIESFVAERVADQWNDFVAVFQREDKGTKQRSNARERIYKQFSCRNVYDMATTANINPDEAPEDQRIIARLNQEISRMVLADEYQRLVAEKAALSLELEQLKAAVTSARSESERLALELAERDARLGELDTVLNAYRAEAVRLTEDLKGRTEQIGVLDARLRVARTDAERLLQEIGNRDLRADELAAAVAAATAEAARLAQEITARDDRIGELDVALAAAAGETERIAQEVVSRDLLIAERDAAVAAATAEAARLVQEITARDGRIGELDAALAAATGERERMAHAVASRDLLVAERDAAVAAATVESNRLGQEIASREQRLGEQEAMLAALQVQADHLAAEVAGQERRNHEVTAALATAQAEIQRWTHELATRDKETAQRDSALSEAKGEIQRLVMEEMRQTAIIGELRNFVGTLTEVIQASEGAGAESVFRRFAAKLFGRSKRVTPARLPAPPPHRMP